jgi:hypothetical protein
MVGEKDLRVNESLVPDGTWRAQYLADPGGSVRLLVEGALTMPTSGYQLSLLEHVPQGFNPKDLLLDLLVEAPSGPVPQHTVEATVTFEAEADGRWETVSVLPDGPTIAIEPPPVAAGVDANSYTLVGDGLEVRFDTSGLKGAPVLSYAFAGDSRTFEPPELHLEPTFVGVLASVLLSDGADRDTVGFTLVVPDAKLGDTHAEVPVETLAIRTRHRITIAGVPPGQSPTYEPITVRGTARAIQF